MKAPRTQRLEYEGRLIEVQRRDGETELLIDGSPVRYGQLPDGSYFLSEYAYDWSSDLMEVARRYVDHLARAEQARSTPPPKKGGE